MKSLDIRPIVENFYRDIFEDDLRSDWEAYILLVIPILVGQLAIFRQISGQFMTIMSTALAILFGFTFNSMMTTAKYSSKNDRMEAEVVRETRLVTSYALLLNLVSLILVVATSIAIVDYSAMSYTVGVAVSAGIFAILSHYFLVMLHLMRYLYLLTMGGAFEDAPVDTKEDSEPEPGEGEERVYR